MSISGSNSELAMLVSLVCVILVFLIDLNIPLGVAGGVPYIIAILVSLWARSEKFTISLAVLCSLLTIWGFYISPVGGELWKVLFNRGIALLAIWSCALITLKYFEEVIKYATLEKEVEKMEVYRKTISGVNHLVRNLQSNFLILTQSETLQNEFGADILTALQKSSDEVSEILDQLGTLEEISAANISDIAFSNIKKK